MTRACLRLILLCLVVLAPGQAALAQGHAFTLREHGREGEASRLYMYNGRALTISEQAAEGLPMLVEVVTLTATQRVEIDAFAAALWDAALTGTYAHPGLNGGHGLTVALTDAAGDTREAYISNYRVEPLAGLVVAINRVVPEAHRSGYASAALPPLPAGRAILPDFAPVYFATEVDRINRAQSALGPVLSKLRRVAREDGRDAERSAEAQQIVDAVAGWARSQRETVDRLRGDDLPAAYTLAEEAARLLRRDRLGETFESFLAEVRADRAVLREVQAELALREAEQMAESIGLGDDVEAVRWDDHARLVARELGDRMDTIGTVYRGTDAARRAGEKIDAWREQVRAIEARQPRWVYTWHIDLIPQGTEERVRLRTDSHGDLVTEIDTEIVYDPHKVVMHGTFQNTSSEAHRYTFVVGLSGNHEEQDPFVSGAVDELLGYERVQTPVLQPGELYEWSAEVALRNIRHIRRGGLGVVVADQPGRAARPGGPGE